MDFRWSMYGCPPVVFFVPFAVSFLPFSCAPSFVPFLVLCLFLAFIAIVSHLQRNFRVYFLEDRTPFLDCLFHSVCMLSYACFPKRINPKTLLLLICSFSTNFCVIYESSYPRLISESSHPLLSLCFFPSLLFHLLPFLLLSLFQSHMCPPFLFCPPSFPPPDSYFFFLLPLFSLLCSLRPLSFPPLCSPSSFSSSSCPPENISKCFATMGYMQNIISRK